MNKITTFCDTLDLKGAFSLKNFNKDLFLKNFDEGKTKPYRLFFGSKENPGERHIHIDVDFNKIQTGRFQILFHNSDYRSRSKDEPPPYMEDCVKWFGEFFVDDLLFVDMIAYYMFDDSYSPIFALPFPLIMENKELSGSSVVGLNVELGKKTLANNIIIQPEEDSLYINIMGRFRVKLKTFDLDQTLNKISAIVMQFIKEKEKPNGSSRKRKPRKK